MKISKNVSVIFSFIIVIGIIILPLIFHVERPQTNQVTQKTSVIIYNHPLVIGTQTISVAISNNEATREQGLSDTQALTPNQGMLFIFDSPTMTSFWMKEMNYPLDIIWIDQNKKVIGVSENLDPKTYPQTFSPVSPIVYVLEVSAGFYKSNNIKIGDSIVFKKKRPILLLTPLIVYIYCGSYLNDKRERERERTSELCALVCT